MAPKFSKSFKISHRIVGQDEPVFIVAEAGVAHFGSMEKAKALVDLAVSAQADAIKFQIFRTDELISSESKDWQDRLRSRELPYESFREIKRYCEGKNIIFFATAHDEPSLEYLNSLDVPVYKIGSGEVANWPFLKKVASMGKPVILSTGMYKMDEIGVALSIFEKAGNPDVSVLHCVTLYPAPPLEVNLRAMETIRKNFDVMVGYSDHTQGFHFPLAAAALGARIIEKHITLDFNVPNAQDWKVSCGPDDLSLMVQQIRDIESGMGTGMKAPGGAERQSLTWARKSLVASRDIAMGEIIETSMVCAKRPGSGISPAFMNEVIGKRAKVNIKKDSVIQREQLK